MSEGDLRDPMHGVVSKRNRHGERRKESGGFVRPLRPPKAFIEGVLICSAYLTIRAKVSEMRGRQGHLQWAVMYWGGFAIVETFWKFVPCCGVYRLGR